MKSESTGRSDVSTAFSDRDHERWKARALELARSVVGRTSPNPAVGAVVVRDERIVGEGATQPPGGPHAEVVALAAAREAARGATLYTTLEPCSHYGRTPPCTEAIIRAGVTEVRYAMADPNPMVAGGGHLGLEAAGISVMSGGGVWATEALRLNETFFHWIRRGRPFVIAKWAMSLDGRIGTRRGDSRWISGKQSRQHVHELRNVVDAVLIGSGTVLADDPFLTTRLDQPDVRHPLRVVLDARGRVPCSSRLVAGSLPGATLMATTSASSPAWRRELAARGTEVLLLPPAASGGIDLDALLDTLGQRSVASLVVEGGSGVLGSFVDAKLVNKYLIFVAALIVGGKDALGPVGGLGVDALTQALRLSLCRLDRLDEDVLLTCYPPTTESGHRRVPVST